MTDVEIVALDFSTWPSLSHLFEAGGDPSRCWCAFWRFPPAEATRMSTAENHAWLEARALGSSDEPAGLVAQQDDAAVGWVSMGPRESYGRIGRARGIPVLPGEQVWSVVCFVMDKSVRRSGLSAQLLAAAGDFAQRRGARIVEAYPVAVPDGARVPAAAAYCGIESTFLKSGYRRVAETTSTAAGLPRVVVRRDL